MKDGVVNGWPARIQASAIDYLANNRKAQINWPQAI
jgi:hypothetical protein